MQTEVTDVENIDESSIEDWQPVTVDEAFEFTRKPRSLDIPEDKPIPFIPMDGISESSRKIDYAESRKKEEIKSGSFVFKDDLLIAKITPSFENGKQAILDELSNDYGYATTEVWVLHPREDVKILKEYLFYYLRRGEIRSDLAGKMEGSTGRQRLPKGVLRNLELYSPPLNEQKRIISILNTVQDVIEQTEAVIQATRELKKSMMKHLFTYGPVPVDQTDQVELKETEFSTVNKDWRKYLLKDLSDIQYGIQAAVSNNTDPSIGTQILTNSNIDIRGYIDYSDQKYYDLTQEKKPGRYIIKMGDVLFNWRSGSRRHVGKVAYFDDDKCMTHSSFILRVRANEELVYHKFLYFYMDYLRRVQEFFYKKHDFMINAKFNKSHTSKIPVYLPDKSIQLQIVNSLTAIENKINHERDYKKSLESLFASLLEELMTAKIRVV